MTGNKLNVEVQDVLLCPLNRIRIDKIRDESVYKNIKIKNIKITNVVYMMYRDAFSQNMYRAVQHLCVHLYAPVSCFGY